MNTRRLVVGLGWLAALSLLAMIVLQVLSGLDYRNQEEQGLEPGYAPEWIVTGTTAGFWILVAALVALAVVGVVQFFKRPTSRSAASGDG